MDLYIEISGRNTGKTRRLSAELYRNVVLSDSYNIYVVHDTKSVKRIEHGFNKIGIPTNRRSVIKYNCNFNDVIRGRPKPINVYFDEFDLIDDRTLYDTYFKLKQWNIDFAYYATTPMKSKTNDSFISYIIEENNYVYFSYSLAANFLDTLYIDAIHNL